MLVRKKKDIEYVESLGINGGNLISYYKDNNDKNIDAITSNNELKKLLYTHRMWCVNDKIIFNDLVIVSNGKLEIIDFQSRKFIGLDEFKEKYPLLNERVINEIKRNKLRNKPISMKKYNKRILK